MHRLFDTGYFSLCRPVAEETRDGIKLTLEVGAPRGRRCCWDHKRCSASFSAAAAQWWWRGVQLACCEPHPPSAAPDRWQVSPNPELRGFTVTGANALPQVGGWGACQHRSSCLLPLELPCRACPEWPPTTHLPATQAVVEEAFSGLFGRTLNFNQMAAAVGKLNRWYEDTGVLGQVRRPACLGLPPLGRRGWMGVGRLSV